MFCFFEPNRIAYFHFKWLLLKEFIARLQTWPQTSMKCLRLWKKPRTVLGWGVRGPDILSRGVYFTVQIIASEFQTITSHARHRAVNSTDHYLCRPSLPRCSTEACLVCPHFLRINVYVWISENTRQIQVLSVPAAVCACTRCGREMVINTARTPLKCVKALSVRQSWWLLKGILKRQHAFLYGDELEWVILFCFSHGKVFFPTIFFFFLVNVVPRRTSGRKCSGTPGTLVIT